MPTGSNSTTARPRRRLGLALVGTMVAALLTVTAPAASIALAASSTTVVRPADMQGWAFYEELPEATGALVTGPATPPLGAGSAQMALDATGREILLNGDYAGTRFADVTTLTYSTYRASADAGNNLAIAIQFDTDYNLTDSNDAWQGRLVFEPYMTLGVSGTVIEDTWQTWDALDGNWWASGAPGNVLCPQASPCLWTDVLTAFPDAGIRVGTTFPGFVNLKAGGPAPGFDGNVDAFTIGVNATETTYDFEPSCAATGLFRDTINLTAALIDPVGPVTGPVDARGCNIGVYYGRDTSGTVSGADIFGANYYGIVVNAADVDVSDTAIHDIGETPLNGSQHGVGVLYTTVNQAGVSTGTSATGTLSDTTITNYQKNGVVISGPGAAVTVQSNTVTGEGAITYIAQNGIQVSTGATATITGNTVSGNNYTPKPWLACGLLFLDAAGVKSSNNTLFENEKNICNFGKGGGQFNPAP